MRLALLIAVAALAAPASKPPAPDPRAPKCEECQYTCLLADNIVQSERKAFLYENIGPIAKNRLALENQVKDLASQWAKRDETNPSSPAFACFRMLMDAGKKTDAELQKVADHADPISSTAMETDWTTKECKINTNGLESKICGPLYESLLAHELSHQKSCQLAWAKVGREAIDVQTNPQLRAMEEARAYRDGANYAEREMKRLAKKRGCGLRASGRNRLAPPPTAQEITDAKRDIEAIPSIMRSGK